ncbi:MAG: GGDEF domain-containing protein [Hungatella sp.]|jgi:diguanylate cyclase (GGDEF)-like protein|nr:GGDEF domain-containing protein [Hungatella sp.]
METLEKIISRYMRQVTCFLVIIILAIIVYIQITNEHRHAYESAVRTFYQIEQVLNQNQEELEEIQKSYSETCLHNAEAIAYMIEKEPSMLGSIAKLKNIAELMEVDEIHIFDKTGRIYAGTHPQYYDFTFDSGDQMRFFKPMLNDKSLKLVQEITPNTAEAKMMQYSALWSKNEEFIVQIGMEPVNVMKASAKNELSFLFSLFRVNLEAGYYAIDSQSGEIVGSTDLTLVGKNLSQLGFTLDSLPDYESGRHGVVNGVKSYCIFKKIGNNYIGRVIASCKLYQRISWTTFMLAAGLIVIALILSHAVTKYMNRYVVDGIHSINDKLHQITQGNLDEMIDIHSSMEFSELSSYINTMKNSLLDNNKKMSYVLSKTNMYIGVYEYNQHMKRVRFTEYVPQILSLDHTEIQRLSSDYKVFKEFIDKLREKPIPNDTGVYQLNDQYVKLEEINDNNGIFGVIINVTDTIRARKKIEAERDIDLLTGLYNRRGLETRLTSLFSSPTELGHSTLIMIDADNLKVINDTYGHEAGDVYLKEISKLLTSLPISHSVAARLGGDEFVLFWYQYDTEQELIDAVHTLKTIQNDSLTPLNDKVSVPLRFSFGYCLARENMDYHDMMKEADKRMYQQKRRRKMDQDSL